MKNKVCLILIITLLMLPINVFAKQNEKVIATLGKCVDGDTAHFIVNNKTIKARFLAIDTPEYSSKEKEKYGDMASQYTCKMLTNAKIIELEYDSGSDKQDKYNRDLVWVFVDKELLQEKLVGIGYAEIKYIYGDYKYTSLLYESQTNAKNNKYGIWSDQKNEFSIENYFNSVFDNQTTSYIAYILSIIALIVSLLATIKKAIKKKKIK